MSKERIQELTDLLNKANDSYYKNSVSLMSDKEFDMKLRELVDLEKKYPEYIASDSPTKRIGSDAVSGFEKVAHEIPMISIDNAYSFEEVQQYMDNIRGALPGEEVDFTSEMKIDGLSLGLRYENGVLSRAVTRGGEGYGDDVTVNARTILDIPVKIPYLGKIEVRGECYIDIATFEAINTWNAAAGQDVYQNPRNLASGSLKLKDPKMTSRRKLRFRAFGIANDIPEVTTQEGAVMFMSSLGFVNVNKVSPTNDMKSFKQVQAALAAGRTSGKIPFAIDGIVVKVNKHSQREKLGRTSKHIKWAIAYKFDSEQASTCVREITYQTGRTGKIVPVAELDPVPLMGSTIRRATLHNMDEIKRLGLHIGDTVFIEKGGDIIPKVISVDKSKRINNTPIIAPTRCPVCGAPLEKREGKNVDVFCSNEQCPAKILNSLTYFVSRTCMNIKDIGPALLEKLLDTGAIHDLLDLYNLMPLHFEGIEGVGPKVVGKVLDNIEDSKNMPPTCLLAGMGIPLVGKNTAVRMMAAFGGWEGLWEASATKIANLPDVGTKAAENFAAWRMENPDFISKIKELGMNMTYQSSVNPEGALAGKVIVVTGTLSTMSRDEAQKLIESNGGVFGKDLTKKTSVLVVGAGTEGGSKRTKAEKFGTEVWTEIMFLERAGQ